LFLVFIPFVHGEVDDPGKFEPLLADKLELLTDLRAGQPGEFRELLRVAGDEERSVAGLEAERKADRLDALRANVVCERPAPAHSSSLRVGAKRSLVLRSVKK